MSLGYRSLLSSISNLGNQPEVDVYISGLITPLSQSQIDALNLFVSSVKSSLGISLLSEAFDFMYILAGETEESSLRNIVNTSHHITKVGTLLAFTQFEGFKNPNTITRYLNTNYNPFSQGVNFTQNDASIGFYSRTNINESSCDIGARNGSGATDSNINIFARTSGESFFRLNTGLVTSNVAVADSLGMFISNRTSSTNQNLYKNSSLLSSNSFESKTPPNYNIYIGARNTANVADSISTRQFSFGFGGRSINSSEVLGLTNAFEFYMDNNGKGVI